MLNLDDIIDIDTIGSNIIDSSTSVSMNAIHYVKNLYTNKQFKWEKEQWTSTWGKYNQTCDVSTCGYTKKHAVSTIFNKYSEAQGVSAAGVYFI